MLISAADIRQMPPRSRGSGLVFTDYCYLFGVVLAVFWVVDPFHLALERSQALKNIPALVTIPALFLAFVGSHLYRGRNHTAPAPIIGTVWPMIVLALWMLGGSLYSRLVLGEPNTFFSAGFGMFFVGPAAGMLLRTADPKALLQRYFIILIAASAYMGAAIIWNYGVVVLYHEEEFIIIPMAVFFAVGPFKPAMRVIGFLFFLSLAFFVNKNTGYLVGLITIVYLLFFCWLPRLKKSSWLRQSSWLYLLLLLSVISAITVAYVLQHRETYLPSGNTVFRIYFYERAWQKFLASPVWGTMFTGPSAEKFSLFQVQTEVQILPTHSDILDILANGGLLGLFLWLYGVYRVGAVAYRRLLRPSLAKTWWFPYAHTLACMSFSAIVTYSFNPILMQAAKAYLIGTSLGILAAIAILNRDPSDWSLSHKHPE